YNYNQHINSFPTRRSSDLMKDFQPGKAGSSKDIAAGNINPESEETTHFSVIDKDGNAVAVTTTLNNSYGSKTVVRGAGFLLNDRSEEHTSELQSPCNLVCR